ncbi:MAG: glucose/galactose MFS transporter [Flavobacteriales bacterium CG_4_8_14_3_um_filter_35_10]|nr:sugar MFS transporter [Zetaproteobacteria bacterium]NDK17484.1 sugar MFS transporter [Flavobacteriales bacterium]PIX07715.1 MAG: glucose/galactose MFS transporter [Flavobacteriales bacterium CG_4_8_14_3_um_filter_35_10]PJA06953.1 MAG: glucose/galactose MFS transporter [Flavobacteriales bacterium CG_4_10_14_0_2_um_filter_35_18]
MSNTTNTASNQKNSTLIPILIIAGVFFIFGFITWINGALIPFMKTISELTSAQSYLVASAFYISYVVMALPSSYILNKIGYRKGMALGMIIMGIGALLFIPAAEARTYWVFLTGIFIQGIGMTLLQTAATPYIIILGPIESAAKRISIMGIANKVAGALGSLIFGALLLSGMDEVKEKLISANDAEKTQLLDVMANSVVLPYFVMAAILVVLGILIRFAPLPHVEAEPIEEKEGETSKTSVFQFPRLWLGALTLFMYVGAEVIAGDTIIAYGISLGFSGEEAKFFTMFTLMAMVATYALGIFLIPKYMHQSTALKISAILGIIFTFYILFTTGLTSVLFVAALGIANALVVPAVWPLTLQGMGKFTKTASAILIMAVSGAAIIPPLYGRLVDENKANLIAQGLNETLAFAEASTFSYWILFPCYLIIVYFAFWGYKIGTKTK